MKSSWARLEVNLKCNRAVKARMRLSVSYPRYCEALQLQVCNCKLLHMLCLGRYHIPVATQQPQAKSYVANGLDRIHVAA